MATTRACRLLLVPLLLVGAGLAAQPAPEPQPTLQQPPSLQSATPGQGSRPALITRKPINQVLPADSAFALQYYPLADSAVLLHWDIEPGYYLYRKSIKLSDSEGREIGVMLPPGREITDEYFGKVETYYDTLDLQVTLDTGTDDPNVTLLLEYQGCAEALYCYPPQQKELVFALPGKP